MSTKLFRTTVTGSYIHGRSNRMRKPTLTREQADEIIRWAVADQVAAGLDVVTMVKVAARTCITFSRSGWMA